MPVRGSCEPSIEVIVKFEEKSWEGGGSGRGGLVGGGGGPVGGRVVGGWVDVNEELKFL